MYLRPRLGRSQNRKELAEISPQPDCPDPRAKKCKYWWSEITHSVYWRKSIMWLWIISVWLCQAMDHKRLQHLFKKTDQAWQRFPLLMLVWLCLLPWIVVIFEKRNITIRSCPPAKVNTHQNLRTTCCKNTSLLTWFWDTCWEWWQWLNQSMASTIVNPAAPSQFTSSCLEFINYWNKEIFNMFWWSSSVNKA